MGLFKKIFGNQKKEDGKLANQQSSAAAPGSGSEPDPAKFVEYVVTNLVSQPDSVKIEPHPEGENGMEILISCAKDDMGRVIGKRGKTISAIRSLAVDTAGRAGIRNLKVELKDD